MSDLLEDLAEDYLEMPLLFSVELPAYMANRGMNPNTLQYIMGHANITMTLGYYAHGTFNSAKAEIERLALAS